MERPPSSPRSRQEIFLGLVEDDAIVRAWIRASLARSEFRLAGEATTAAEARRLVERRRPDVLLVDYNLPDGKATALVQELRRSGEQVPVLVITATPRPGLNEAVRESGAQGVLTKESDPEELLRSLRAVAGGAPAFDARVPRRPSGQAPLSPREREVLALLASGRTNPEIAAELGIGRESVKTLVRRVFAKVGASNRMEAVARARERGLLP